MKRADAADPRRYRLQRLADAQAVQAGAAGLHRRADA